jgi:hypothetical protein
VPLACHYGRQTRVTPGHLVPRQPAQAVSAPLILYDSQADSEGSIPFTRSSAANTRACGMTCGHRRCPAKWPKRSYHPIGPTCSPIAHTKLWITLVRAGPISPTMRPAPRRRVPVAITTKPRRPHQDGPLAPPHGGPGVNRPPARSPSQAAAPARVPAPRRHDSTGRSLRPPSSTGQQRLRFSRRLLSH